ncbi:MAG TPA: sigma factor-like helix-turn-helix DNA-binding protein, partial [Steroidobacteraceae bacterium]|nr:sigma factor-like helix-turn-helix DNA-binding protein [Steroidobacteraceae bacterium]
KMTGAPRINRVQLNGADIEYDVRGSGEPVVFIHGAVLSDGFLPVIEQAGIAENFRIVNYRRRGYAGSSRSVAGMTVQDWADDCIALLNHRPHLSLDMLGSEAAEVLEPLTADPGAGPVAAAEARDQATALRQALARLPPEQRDAFLLQLEGDLSVEDVAAITHASFETVKSRLRYARTRLREMLAEYA